MNTPEIIAVSVAGVVAALFIVRMIVRSPVAILGALLQNLIVGCVGLLVLDYVGKAIGIHVPLNFATAGVVSVLGLPGVAALAVIHKWVL